MTAPGGAFRQVEDWRLGRSESALVS